MEQGRGSGCYRRIATVLETVLFYALPPFAILPSVLQKIAFDKAIGILVVPYWKTRSWYPLFTSLLAKDPISFWGSILICWIVLTGCIRWGHRQPWWQGYYQGKKLPQSMVWIFSSSVTDSILLQYDTAWKKWSDYCQDRHLDHLKKSVTTTLEFLALLYNNGAWYKSVNTARFAIAFLISPDLGTDHRISRFCKGTYNLRPSAPSYDSTWDPSQVLSYLETLFPNELIPFSLLTEKLAGLFALVSAHRIIPDRDRQHRTERRGRGYKNYP